MKTIINLTPHTVTANGKTFAPSGWIPTPRVDQHRIKISTVEEIPLYTVQNGNVSDLPDQDLDVFLIVSAMIRSVLPDRTDLISPGKLIRDDNGNVIGCDGFDTNL